MSFVWDPSIHGHLFHRGHLWETNESFYLRTNIANSVIFCSNCFFSVNRITGNPNWWKPQFWDDKNSFYYSATVLISVKWTYNYFQAKEIVMCQNGKKKKKIASFITIAKLKRARFVYIFTKEHGTQFILLISGIHGKLEKYNWLFKENQNP